VTPDEDEKEWNLVDAAQFHLHACPFCGDPVWHTPRH
jgi:hypothetical protein